MILLFAGQALAGGIMCGIDTLSNGFDNTSEMSCPIQGESECDEMACCAQGQSPTGSVVAMICCEVKCGESTGGAQFNFTPQTLTLAPPVLIIRVVSLVPLNETAASRSSLSIRSAENHLLHHHPPDLFLCNSSFLI